MRRKFHSTTYILSGESTYIWKEHAKRRDLCIAQSLGMLVLSFFWESAINRFGIDLWSPRTHSHNPIRCFFWGPREIILMMWDQIEWPRSISQMHFWGFNEDQVLLSCMSAQSTSIPLQKLLLYKSSYMVTSRRLIHSFVLTFDHDNKIVWVSLSINTLKICCFCKLLHLSIKYWRIIFVGSKTY